ncbi:MAG: TIGR03435 family protein [Acidobacteriota bacterium]
MRTPLFAIFAVAAVTGFAQTAPNLAFDVASIRPAEQLPQGQGAAAIHVDGQQMRCVHFSLKEYIGIAYRLKMPQISGPDWIADARFDISATLPAGSTMNQFPDMLQALLAERFGLKLHHDKKEFSVWALELGKGPLKLKEVPVDPNAPPPSGVQASGSGSAAGVSVNLGNGVSYTFANNKFEVKKMTMALATSQMERYLDRPFVDMTGLTGSYDFSVDISDEDYRVMLIRAAVASGAGAQIPPQAMRLLDGSTLGSLLDGVEKLGLKMENKKAPLDIVVIDQMNKTPTEN